MTLAHRVTDVGTWVGRVIRSAPGTYTWLAVLLVTTILQHVLPADAVHHILAARSTNLVELTRHPVRVLWSSLFWLDGAYWFAYFVLYNIFHVPVERWLGTVRWLAVCLITHIGATLISQGLLSLAIREGAEPMSKAYVLDFGVSYALAGVAGILTYHIRRPWCFVYVVVVVGFLAIPLFGDVTFTDVGHFTAALIGLLCYPLIPADRRPRLFGAKHSSTAPDG
ncbi:membrane protein [Gordonia jinhuaensis]|uniref:Membrane protein n=1 Tax=Gordonia jinhuaensis TaxID=1517702 RepID=A0A916WQV4_9ACTN|nr:rhomboid-like protein [Gordonia jinhuaensis]GGB23987.1 membrane protein [Gordonia jinhuaensis]